MEKTFRFAILGAGNIAKTFVKAARLAHCEVIAVASKSMEKAQKFAADNAIAAAYDDYKTMLLSEKPDCAYIATVPSSHFELSMLCMEIGIPVLCEKAMFRNSGEAIAAFAKSEEKGLFMMEALWSKFLPTIEKAKEWLDAGKIGKPVLCESMLGFTPPKDPTNRYFNPDLGGGAALDITVYAYEIAAFIMGCEPELLSVAVTRGATGTDDTEIALMRAGDCPVTVKTSFVSNFNNGITIYGENGRIFVPNHHVTKEAFLYDGNGEVVEHFTDTVTEEGFTYEILETEKCVRAGKVESEREPHSATIACAKLFDAIHNA